MRIVLSEKIVAWEKERGSPLKKKINILIYDSLTFTTSIFLYHKFPMSQPHVSLRMRCYKYFFQLNQFESVSGRQKTYNIANVMSRSNLLCAVTAWDNSMYNQRPHQRSSIGFDSFCSKHFNDMLWIDPYEDAEKLD